MKRFLPPGRRTLALMVSAIIVAVIAAALPMAASVQAAGVVSGSVFRDFDGDGVRDETEPGVGGITVTAYDPAGAVAGIAVSFATLCLGPGNPRAECTALNTPAIGSYTLNAGGTGPYRIEFSGWPAYMRPAVQGAGNNTSIQFVPDGNSSNINFALHNPAEYCQQGPDLVTSCYTNGDPQGGGTTAGRYAIVQVPFEPATTGPGDNVYLATGLQVGATWGLAYQRSSRTLMAAAVVKRHVGFGVGGIGAIYRIDRDRVAAPTVLIDLNAAGYPPGVAVGPDPRSPGDLAINEADPSRDPLGFDAVGKRGIGGISLSEDEDTLWVVNLTTRTLLEIRIGVPPVTPTAADITVHPLPTPACSDGEFRPWAVKAYAGQVYVGGVCSGEFPYAGKNIDTTDLTAHIYRHDPNGPTGNFTEVFSFPLNYPRGLVSRGNPGDPRPSAAWLPWINEWSDISPPMPLPGQGPFGQTMYPQPMLTSIDFDVDGAILVALNDRAGMQLGDRNYSTIAGDTGEYTGVAAGDLVRVCANPATPSGYSLENAGACPGGLTGGSTTNRQGPGNGEFYSRDEYGTAHDEVTIGGIVMHYGLRRVITTAYDALPAEQQGPVRSGGLRWFNAANGALTDAYVIFGQDQPIGSPPGTRLRRASFGKSAGLGDLETFCDQAPIEIGNRVWLDANRNGVQDPDEAPIPGVTVELWRNGTRIGVAVTDAEGTYYFRSGRDQVDANLEDNIIHDGGIGIRTRTGTPGGASAYEIRIPNITGPNQQTALVNLTLTFANNDDNPNGDSRDSDGVAIGNNAVFVIPYGNHAAAGTNNHTYDFGFFEGVPTAIVLEYFTAGWEGGTLTVRWATVMELDTAGFRLLRSATGRIDDAVSVTPTLIRARGSPGSGAAYEWRDPTAQPGASYTYWLEEIETTGRVNRYGPATARVQATSPLYRVMIPVIVR
jgi:hypothetical protein